MTDVRIAIPRDVLLALRDVERRRLVDMYDREIVILFVDVFGHAAAAAWMAEHRHLYFLALDEARTGCNIRGGSPELAVLTS